LGSAVALACLGLVAACAEKDEKVPPVKAGALKLTPAPFESLPGWNFDRVGDSLVAFLRSCTRLDPQPEDRPIGGAIPGRVGDWREPCAAARTVPPGDEAAARAFLRTWFTPFKALNQRKPEGLFTGYYEAELGGSWRPSAQFATPLYKRPADLVDLDLGQFRSDLQGERITGRVEGGRFVPYFDRDAIDFGGALTGRGLELLWVDDPIDAFVLHIQGSGRVKMADGSVVRVGFAGKNGRPYRSIGRELVRRGEMTLSEASMQRIKRWIADNPGQARDIMGHNPSYVFFKENRGEGPIGAQGAPLTPGRSLAVDRKFIPLGTPIWLDLPYRGAPGDRIQRLVVAQDTGGAIKGPVRGDFFWGYGDQAAQYAGRMKSRGEYYLLLPRAVAARLTRTPLLVASLEGP